MIVAPLPKPAAQTLLHLAPHLPNAPIPDLSSFLTPYIAFYITPNPLQNPRFLPLLTNTLTLHHPIFQSAVTVIDTSSVESNPSLDTLLTAMNLNAQASAIVILVEKQSGAAIQAWDDIEEHPEKR
ncbi:hypothetical protein HK097_011388, partial [Rhizophlyctis rosea]